MSSFRTRTTLLSRNQPCTSEISAVRPFSFPKHDCSYRMMFQSLLLEEKVEPAAFMEMNSVEAIKKCLQNGIGIAMLPEMSVSNELAQSKMTVLNWPGEKLETGILMIWHRDKWLSPILKTFMDIVRE